MLAEYALGSCIFDIECYTGDEKERRQLCYSKLREIKEIILEEEALVRDLRNGAWSKYVSNYPSKHSDTKYIIEKLRLRKVKAAKATTLPSSHDEWCQEAVDSHINETLNAILTSQKTAENFPGVAEVCSIEKLTIARWLQTHSCSVRLKRNIREYLKYLAVVFNQAKMIKFIDPYFEPTRKDYSNFHDLINAARREAKEPKKLIEIHLKHTLEEAKAKQQFQILSPTLQSANLTAQVFFWTDFHDRYLITDIIGINLNNGLNTDNQLTTWTKLSKSHRNNINDEFKPDPVSKKSLVGDHLLCYKFSLP
ncbi:MIT C-terminal domain-containing protein [Anabaena sp. CCY 9910]|uniref:MIT C-terminal domain-containing protein n=1 Tax=Anabaena sp. CCY 9910 TaxID=3103870 RepID=UPI0039E186AA